MKKIILSLILLSGLGIASFSQSGAVLSGPGQCDTGGLANVNCPYWDVTYEVSSGFWPWESATIKITCHTGGEFQCQKTN